MKQPVVLRVYKGDKLEAVRQFEHSQIVIGRNSDVQLELQDEGVALLHAMIEDRDGEYFLSDLGSTSGTFKNGSRVLEDRLASGDSLTIGPFKVQFFIGVPKPAAPPKIGNVGSAATDDTAPRPIAPPAAVSFTSVPEPPASFKDQDLEVEPPPAPPVNAASPKKSEPKVAPIVTTPATTPVTPANAIAPPAAGAAANANASAKPAAPKGASPASTTTSATASPTVSTSGPERKKEPIAGFVPIPTAAPGTGPAKSGGARGGFVPAAGGGHRKSKKTFAPPSPYKNLKDIIRPHKGSLVEVLVTWNDKILSSNHFSQPGSVFISSSPDADVIVPIINSKSKYELLKIAGQITVCLTQEMTGELIRDGETLSFSELARQNKIRNVGTHFELDVRQGEMVRIGLQNELISIYVRYAADTPKPLVAPLLDMTSSEVTGIILALAVSLILGLYMNIYTPSPLLDDENRQEEPIRKAVVMFKPPPKKEVEEPKVEETPKEVKKVVKAEDKKKTVKAQAAQSEKADPGKAAEVAPNPNVKPKPNKLVSAKPGAAIKTAPKEGANMKAERPDPTKQGLLGVFSSKGAQKQIDKAYSGSGELQGMADSATGFAGNAENRDGDSLGSKLKEAGSGKGSSTVGIAGVGTKGRGTGGTGYGTGGLGQKGNAQIHIDGAEADFAGGMDKEAIRRVIREHLREIRNCYERELQTHPDLYGKISLEWDIEEGGRVTRCVVKNNAIGNDAVANCLVNRLKTWKFPDPPKDQIGRVVYPFVFSSQ